jgi:hypothetical protein
MLMVHAHGHNIRSHFSSRLRRRRLCSDSSRLRLRRGRRRAAARQRRATAVQEQQLDSFDFVGGGGEQQLDSFDFEWVRREAVGTRLFAMAAAMKEIKAKIAMKAMKKIKAKKNTGMRASFSKDKSWSATWVGMYYQWELVDLKWDKGNVLETWTATLRPGWEAEKDIKAMQAKKETIAMKAMKEMKAMKKIKAKIAVKAKKAMKAK